MRSLKMGLWTLSFVAVFAFLDQSSAIPCARDNFRCSQSECTYESWVCDNKTDCANGQDEVNCGKNCAIRHYRCSDDTCIKNHKVCDGRPDCQDGGDEARCGSQCRNTEFSCSDGQCILNQGVRCNGKKECDDGSDEEECDVKTRCTHEHKFACPNGTCIGKTNVCDGIADCTDGRDEENCAPTTVPPTATPCPNQEVRCWDGSCAANKVQCLFLDLETLLSSNTSSNEGDQQCTLEKGCAVKVVAMVIGLLALLTVIFIGGFYFWYRQKYLTGECQYVSMYQHQESEPPNEAITLGSVP